MYFETEEYLWGLVLPAVGGLLVAALTMGRRWGMAIALGGVYALCEWRMFGYFEWMPSVSHFWFMHAAALAALIGAVGWLKPIPAAARWIAAAMLMIGAVLVTVRSQLFLDQWMTWESVWWCLGLAAAWLVLFWAHDRTARRVPAPTMTWLWMQIFMLCTTAAFLSWSQQRMQQGYIMTFALMGAGLATVFFRKAQLSGGPTLVLTIMLGLLLLNQKLGVDDTPLPWWSVAAMAALPLLGWLRVVKPIRKFKAGMATVVILVVAFLVYAAILTPAVIQYIQDNPRP